MKKSLKPLLFLAIFALCACNVPTPADTPVTGVSLSESSLTLDVSATETLVATVAPLNATNKAVSWSVDYSSIATISQEGLVTAYSSGDAIVTVTTDDGGFTSSCSVHVNTVSQPDNVTSVSLNKSSLILDIGDTETLTATVFPGTALNKNVTWSSTVSSVASVNSSGQVEALAAGNTVIKVTTSDGGFEAECSIKVNANAENPSGLWDTTQDSLRTGSKTLDFYNLNDFHGATEFDSDTYEPGILKLSTFLKNKKSANSDGFVLTSSGDMWQGSADSNITKGRLVDDWMKILNFSAMALGNHEFDWTIDTIKSNMASASFPILACNIIEDSTGEPVTWAQPYTTITRQGVHIGIIGAIGEGITSDILASNVTGLTFADPQNYVIKWSNLLKQNGADIILYLLHDSIKNVSSSEGAAVNLIFGGHTHAGENGNSNYSAPAIQAYSNGKDVGHICLTYNFSTKATSTVTAEYIDTRSFTLSSLADDSETNTMYQAYLDSEISAIKDEVVLKNGPGIAYNTIPYVYNQYALKYFKDVKDTTNYYSIFAVESNNARSLIASGDITYGMIYKSLPFDNCLYLVSVTGANIKNHLSTYSSSHFYVTGSQANVDSSGINSYVSTSQTYYMLMLDYIAVSSYAASYVTVIDTFTDEASYPRNIVKSYIGNYPSNFIS